MRFLMGWENKPKVQTTLLFSLKISLKNATENNDMFSQMNNESLSQADCHWRMLFKREENGPRWKVREYGIEWRAVKMANLNKH